MHISGCFDNENGAQITGSVATGREVSNSGISSAMRSEGEIANRRLKSRLKW